MTEPLNVETQMVGEVDRRRRLEEEAVAAVSEMTVSELEEAGLRPGPAEDLRRGAQQQSGRRRPRREDVAEAADSLTEEQRQALADAVPTTSDEEQS